MKKLGKTTYLVIAGSVLLLSILLAIIFSLVPPNHGMLQFYSKDPGNLTIYIIDKVIVSLSLIIVVGLTCFGKRAQYFVANVWIFYFTLGIQLLPLLPRLLSALVAKNVAGSAGWLWAISAVVSLIVLIIYVVRVLLIAIMGKRHAETEQQVKPTEVQVVSNDSYFANDGSFSGPEGEFKGPRG